MGVYGAATEPRRPHSSWPACPRIMLGLLLMIAIYVIARIKGLPPSQPRATLREVLQAGAIRSGAMC